MSKTQVFVKQAAGDVREVEVESGGVVRLSPGEQLVIAASPDQAQVDSDSPGEVTIKLEGVGEFTVESAEEIPDQIAQAPEIMGIRPLPTIVFEPTRVDLAEDAPTHEPLGVHQARVDSTAFLDRHTGDDFGMGQALDMAEFSGLAGAGLSGRKIASDEDEDGLSGDSLDGLLGDGMPGDPQDHPNLPPVIDINNILMVDDDATESLTGHLRATDRESGPGDLKFRISQGPAYGVLMIDGKEVDATKVTFTQADIDSGRVTFRFDHHAQDRVLVLEDDTFVFTVTDGVHTTGPATFRIHNTTVQVWGTNESDDLTNVAHFDRDGAKFHVYGFDGDDTLRGGSDADTLEGGDHASTDVLYGTGTGGGGWESVWVPGATPGGDTADYGASNAAVDVDLERARQSGGHAEGDELRGIENVMGSRYGDTLRGDAGNNVLAGLAGADLLDGRLGRDTADYRESDAAVDVDLTRTGAQSGGHAEGDTLVGIENVIGSAFADSIVGNAEHNFFDGGAGDDTLLGGIGNDTLRGGTGADFMDGGIDGTWVDFRGQTQTAHGQDLADYSTSDAAVNVDLTRTGAQSGGHAEGDTLVGIEDVVGTRFGDVITGDAKDNRLWGGDGDDTISGRGGYDIISGGAGHDWIDGGAYADELFGGAGNDTIYGGNGIDTLFGGDGDDYLVGYNPDGSADKSQDLLIGGAGNDTLDASHETYRDSYSPAGKWSTLIGGMGADMLIGNGTSTSASYELSGHNDFELNYGKGVYLDLRRQGKDADGWLAQIDPEGRDTDAVGDTLIGIVNAVGTYSSTGDTLIGNHQNNEMYGMAGDDLMIGNEGNDTLWGWDGNDTLEGGAGADLLWGGWGYDMVSYRNASQGVRIDLGNQNNKRGQVGAPGGEENGDELWYVDGVIGSDHADTLIGSSVGDDENNTWGGTLSSVHNLLKGGAGNDLLMGLGGADTLDGGDGIDTADYSLSEDSVCVDLNLTGPQTGGGEVTKTPTTIDGSNPGNFYGDNHARGDVLISIENVTGSAHDDELIGNGEDNVLSGLAGADSIAGGGGSDTVDYGASASGVKVDLNLQDGSTAQTGGEAGNHADGDVLTGMENVTGSAHADTLVGDAGANILSGLDGDDVITAGAGDTVDGGAGSDVLLSSDANLDIATSTRITGIERVDLTGDAASLTVSGDAILNNGVADPLGGSAKALIVNGDAWDSVHFADDKWAWQALPDSQILADGKAYRVYEAASDGETVRLYVQTVVDTDLNDPPVIEGTGVLGVHDTATAVLAPVDLHASDTDNSPAELSYAITSELKYSELLVDGVLQADYSNPVFTQEDIDQGRVSFRFVPRALDTAQAFTDDVFTVTVSDGTNTTSAHTFTIRNDLVQAWGTNAPDDLAQLTDYDDPASTFHVYGFDGNDTMRGGSGADTLDGGDHAYAWHTPWLYTQEGGDTVDYGASTAAVDIDLTRETQSGGHAEGDALIGVENVVGSEYNDSIVGDGASNLLVGLVGNDTLMGGEGNDTLRGGAGADLIDGGLGWDFADYRTSASWVAVDLNIQDGLTAQSGGGADNHALGDTLIGIENVIGSAFADSIVGDALSNHLIGLDGDDILVGNAGNDTFVGGAGADVLSGGTGTRDLADYSASTAWVNVDLTKQDGTTAQSGGGAGNHALGDILTGIECVNGSAYGDSILGNTVDNVIFSYGGNDTVFAGNGYDTVNGGDGEDSIDGGGRADELYGGGGNDTVYGGDWIDTLFGGAGDDVLYGHRSDGGSDGDQDLLMGGTGNDTLVSLSTDRSTLIGCQGADRIMGGGADNVSYEITDDDFTVNYGKSVYIDLRIQDGVTAQSGGEEGNDAVGDVLTGIRHIVGTYGMAGDTLIGDDNGNEIYGVDGHDLIIGGGGNDIIWGNEHNDTLEGGAGADLLWGGMDFDMVSYRNASQGVRIDLRNQSNYGVQSGAPGGEENGDQLWYVDGVIGSAHADTLIGGSVGDEAFATSFWRAYREAANRLEGGAGDDLLMGLGAADTLDGGEGIDTADYSLSEDSVRVDLNLATGQTGGGEVTETPSSIDSSNPGIFYGGNHARGDVLSNIENVTGSAYGDTLIGNGENNVLSGLDGNDSLAGGGGNDTLIDGVGSDTLHGGDGDDRIYAGAGDVVDGGAGHDVLASDADYLDVTSSSMTITGIERIDLTGVCKSLDVSGDAILNIGISDPAGGGLMALVVTGDAGDSVVRLPDGGWTWNLVDENAAIDGQAYVLYEAAKDGQTVRLYVQTGLNVIEIPDGVHSVLGSEGADDLTTAWGFNDPRFAFIVHGLEGDDTLRGGSGADTLDGGIGIDTADYSEISAVVGVDIDLGRTGVQFGGHAEGDTLIDIENVIGTRRNDTIVGDDGANRLHGMDGDDILSGGAGADFLDGGAGIDTANYYDINAVAGVYIDLRSTGAQSGGHAQGDTLVGIENVIGSKHNDRIVGSNGTDYLYGMEGNDYIWGVWGNDTLDGGVGNDTLQGGNGHDLLVGGAGADFLEGGNDIDTADYSDGAAWVNVDLRLTTEQAGGGDGNHALGDTLSDIENLTGTNDTLHGDVLIGNYTHNVLSGLLGDDTLMGGVGNDTLLGGDGNDLLVGGFTDSVDGGAGFDIFRLEDNAGTGSALDLTAMNGAGRIKGIETMDITGDADDANTLTLKASDVLDTTGGSDTLWVRGDANDTVTTTDTGWTHVGVTTGDDGQQYNHYSGYADSTLVNLMIDMDLATQNIVHA
ncbi:MAG: cadherin-like domain-containing protein [Desulfomicrobium sp.]